MVVVDDYVDSGRSLGLLLTAMGHTVQVFHCPLECLAGWEAFRPNWMLLDIQMPEMSGWELAERIRVTADRALKLVAVTAKGHPEDRERSKQAGFDHHLVKPLSYAELVALFKAAT